MRKMAASGPPSAVLGAHRRHGAGHPSSREPDESSVLALNQGINRDAGAWGSRPGLDANPARQPVRLQVPRTLFVPVRKGPQPLSQQRFDLGYAQRRGTFPAVDGEPGVGAARKVLPARRVAVLDEDARRVELAGDAVSGPKIAVDARLLPLQHHVEDRSVVGRPRSRTTVGRPPRRHPAVTFAHELNTHAGPLKLV